MDYIYALLLGIVQGLTEWLPISSTGHLILTERLFGLDPATFNLTFDAAIQLGTTAAVMFYFRQDLWNLVRHFRRPKERKLLAALVIATIPAIVFGLLLENSIEGAFRQLEVIAGALFAGGIVFLVVERFAKKRKSAEQTTALDAAIIGLAQAAALVPGVSRSGATIVAGMLLGLDRAEAARFTFLLSIPIILIAGGKKFLDVAQGGAEGRLDLILIGMVTAAIVGYLTIKFLLRYLARHRLDGFAYYRFLLAGVIVISLLAT